MRFIPVYIVFIGLLLSACSYHYTLYIAVDPTASPPVLSESADKGLIGPKELPIPGGKPTDPMSIEPGDFTASQTQGGTMINIILNVNSSKPTEVTTDTSLSGIPGL